MNSLRLLRNLITRSHPHIIKKCLKTVPIIRTLCVKSTTSGDKLKLTTENMSAAAPAPDNIKYSHEPELTDRVSRSFLMLETIDTNIYRSVSLWQPTGSRFVFGGQVVGQALAAAGYTVDKKYLVHSLHCYFLKGGNSQHPILYHVDRTRDGTIYCSRNVKATQSGEAIFTMQVSYKQKENDPFEHQYTMPIVKGPEGLLNTKQIIHQRLSLDETTREQKAYFKKSLKERIPYEMRPVDPQQWSRGKVTDPKRYTWVRVTGNVGKAGQNDGGNNPQMHSCVMASMSDLTLLSAAILPFSSEQKIGFMCSLDHAMWFHNDFHVNEWLLYEAESPQCGSGRGFCLGRLWRQDGVLAVSVAQEGVIRSAKL